jgi:IMP dehydrogenase
MTVLSFDDVLLVPQFSKIMSRKSIDISTKLTNLKLELPIIASPMDTISEAEMVIAMARDGGMAVIHRYNTIEEQCAIVREVKNSWGVPEIEIAAAIGVGGDYLQRALALVATGVSVLCVDVAHGHHILVKKAIQALRKELGTSIHIMAGNVATGEAFHCLARWGADSVRVGIGSGSICSTRIQTGHGMPLLESIRQCAEMKKTHGLDTAIIADGGIKNAGDIVKALAFGANAVMCGSLLSGTDETPGDVVLGHDGRKHKTYRGMASRASQEDWRGKGNSSAPEGIATVVEYKGSVRDVLLDLRGNIQSGFSYSGVDNLKDLQEGFTWIRQTSAGQFESATHILSKK